MEMQAHKLDMPEAKGKTQDAFELLVVDAELVFGKAGGDVGMGVGSDVRIDPEAHRSRFPGLSGKLVDDLKLGGGLHIEAADALLKGIVNLPVALPHPGEHYAFRSKSRIEGSLDLPAAHAVSPKSERGYFLEDDRVEIGLYCIMHLCSGQDSRRFGHLAEGAAQKVEVVVIERRAQRGEPFYRKNTFKHCRRGIC